jgi:outer membrane receptor protein involved in Fe transport
MLSGLWLLFGTVSMPAISTAMAQENVSGLETITVTARKRTESLLDVPVAVVAISKTALQNNAANDFQKIAELAPQVIIGRSPSNTGAVITIRGISSGTVDSGIDQSVAFDIDGVALSRGRILQSAQFDMQQVQILQGPQALFFGKNSPAGVISIQSVDPTDRLEAFVKAGYEFKAKEKYVEAAVSGPIARNLKARLAFRYDAMDGWIKNIAVPIANPFQPSGPYRGAVQGDTQPMGHDLTGRLTLLWEPTDDFDAKFKLTMGSERQNTTSGASETYCINGQTVPVILGVPQPHGDCVANMVVAQNGMPAAFAVNYPNGNGGVPFLRSDLGLASLTLNKKFGDMTLTSTTGYYDQFFKGSYVADYAEISQIYGGEGERFRQINEELRLSTDFSGPINAMVGAYYEHSNRRFYNAPSVLFTYDPAAGNYASLLLSSKNKNDSYSVFGQLRWKILPNLELAGGARFTHDTKNTALVNLQTNLASGTGRAAYPQGQILNVHYASNNVSPEATLTWKPRSDQTLYAAYKTGYKAGGISSPVTFPATTTAANAKFGPEKTNGFELGYKADLFANKVRVDLVAYRYNYNGLQVSALDQVTFKLSLLNAAKARTTGVTGTFEWMATDRLSFSGNLGWNRARYLSFRNAQCYTGQTAAQGCVGGEQDLSGKPLNRAPNVTFKLGADYKADLAPGWLADLSISGAYTSSYQAHTQYAPGGVQPSYWLLNAAVHISPENEKYRLSLIGRNLTNSYPKVYVSQQALGAPTQYFGIFNRPRELLIEASYRF